MKTNAFVVLVCGMLCSSCSASIATLEVEVKDECGVPVTNAHLLVSTQKRLGLGLGSRKSDYQVSEGYVDRMGIVKHSFHCPSGDCVFWIEAEGFYPTIRMPVHYKIIESKLNLQVSLAENHKHINVKLRKIIDPQPMFAIGSGQFFSVEDDVFSRGFDLKVGDWVRPFGKGEVSDFTIDKNSSMSNGILRIHSVLRIDGNGNGAYVENIDKSSEFKSCYKADDSRLMKKEFVFEAVKFPNYTYKATPPIVSSDEYMVLRTRSIYDGKGNLISCNFSKIFGEVKIHCGFSCLSSAFNPNSQDRNIEFDTSRNLNTKTQGVLFP